MGQQHMCCAALSLLSCSTIILLKWLPKELIATHLSFRLQVRNILLFLVVLFSNWCKRLLVVIQFFTQIFASTGCLEKCLLYFLSDRNHNILARIIRSGYCRDRLKRFKYQLFVTFNLISQGIHRYNHCH